MRHVEDKNLVTCYWSMAIVASRGDAKGCSIHRVAKFGSEKEQ